MAPPPGARAGLDTVPLDRMARLLRQSDADLHRLFDAEEFRDAGNGPGRIGSLAARFAAKEACCKLFPRETALGTIEPMDFAVRNDPFGAPSIEPSPTARTVLDRHRVERIRVSLSHTAEVATAIAWTEPKAIDPPWYGRLIYNVLPLRRKIVLANLRRVFGDDLAEPEIRRLAQAFYGHYVRCFAELLGRPFLSSEKRKSWVRIENLESPVEAHKQGKGIILLTGHFGNWEMATVAGIGQLSQYKGLLHFVRRPLKPEILDRFVTARFRNAGFGVLGRRDSLEEILDLLSGGAIVVIVFDQHAGGRRGIPVDFLGSPADTFKSLAILAMSTGAPVIPASSWREPDGSHVLRFEEPLQPIEDPDVGAAIRLNTRSYNEALERMLLRHPEQWIWMHKRWKIDGR
ncbi:MAG TPA: 4'-phosphopantetheinyl transferase superfamily protein [Candidatus Eisenbacteria bacterium]